MLEVEQRSGVAVVRLRHGKVNALDLELLQALTAALREVDESAAVVITGTGTAFSAGVDLQRIVAGGPSYVQEFLPALSAAFMAVFDRRGPVLAAINGHAIAGGCVIAAACDVRVMSQGKIGLAELSVGVPFPPSAMEILRHVAGPAAGRLVLTAALLDALR
jgi:enoyl-CoA hydratase